MVTKWGFSSKLGVQYLDDKEKLSGETQNIIDTEVRKLLDESYERSKGLLQTHQKELKLVAEALIEHETLSGSEIADIFKGKPLNLRVRTQKASRELSPMPESKKNSKLLPPTVLTNNNSTFTQSTTPPSSTNPNTNTATTTTPTATPPQVKTATTVPNENITPNTTTSTTTTTKASSSTQHTQQTEKNSNHQTPIRGPPVTPK